MSKIIRSIVQNTIVFGAIFTLRFIYKIALRPWLSGGCRFHPSCSAYGIEALKQHPPFKALFLIVWRIARCHPWGPCGYDPVPPPSSR